MNLWFLLTVIQDRYILPNSIYCYQSHYWKWRLVVQGSLFVFLQFHTRALNMNIKDIVMLVYAHLYIFLYLSDRGI